MSKKKFDFGIPYQSSAEIRNGFFKFFEERDHKFVRSAGVFPKDDPTLLFTNAGMNQFKAIFLGDNREGLKRAHNSQKCLRVSGKHNDLDEVGRDTYHHTFFEMLGNWSFGDYYKKEAIEWAWQLLTDVYKLPKNRLFVTVYKDDQEAEDLWKELTDIEHHRIMRFDEKDNFWEMGNVGPCGPCSEIHFDLGDLATQNDTYQDKVGGVNGEDGRYVEIWNLVFMQNERLADGSLKPLTAKHVDTGAGLERICSVIQQTGSNYETDLFQPMISKIAELSGIPYDSDEKGTPHRVIADHIRALTFAIADGATPGNEGRGYVLRRILRRASRFAHDLGQKHPFLFKIVAPLVETMKDAFPEVKERQAYIEQVIEAEEKRFLKTLGQGLQRFEKLIEDVNKKKKDTIAGKEVFLLYDTYGFPTDLTEMLAEEKNLKIDHAGYETCMEEQRERARSAAKFDASFTSDESWNIIEPSVDTKFLGYDTLTAEMKTLRYREEGDYIFLVCNQTPFYAESGGQVGDQGIIKGENIELKVVDTFKVLEMWVHKCSLVNGLVNEDSLKNLTGQVDENFRLKAMSNHSATHLLHSALRQQLGDHVVQQGSYVGADRLRFDFTHHQGMSKDEVESVESMVNNFIRKNDLVDSQVMPFDEAKESGAMTLFGEKYGDKVRVITMGTSSKELCGGTHTKATGDIGCFHIVSESSIAAGIRRIEAVTGETAQKLMRSQSNTLQNLAHSLKVKPDQVADKIGEVSDKLKNLEKELKTLRTAQLNQLADQMISEDKKTIGDHYVIIKKISPDLVPTNLFQTLLDSLSGKLGDGVAVLTVASADSLTILAAVGEGLRKKIKAGDIVKELAKHCDGRGGGRPDKAQAGSKSPEKQDTVLKEAESFLKTKLL